MENKNLNTYTFRIKWASGGVSKKNIKAKTYDEALTLVTLWANQTKAGKKTRTYAGKFNTVQYVKMTKPNDDLKEFIRREVIRQINELKK